MWTDYNDTRRRAAADRAASHDAANACRRGACTKLPVRWGDRAIRPQFPWIRAAGVSGAAAVEAPDGRTDAGTRRHCTGTAAGMEGSASAKRQRYCAAIRRCCRSPAPALPCMNSVWEFFFCAGSLEPGQRDNGGD